MPTYASVEQYADHVLTETARVIDDLCEQVGPQHPAVLALSGLLVEAATILQQQCMQRERGAPGAYDLMTLPPPVPSAPEGETLFAPEGKRPFAKE